MKALLTLFAVLGLLSGCTSNRIEHLTINPGVPSPSYGFGGPALSVDVRQSGYKAAQGDDSRVEATNDAQASVTP